MAVTVRDGNSSRYTQRTSSIVSGRVPQAPGRIKAATPKPISQRSVQSLPGVKPSSAPASAPAGRSSSSQGTTAGRSQMYGKSQPNAKAFAGPGSRKGRDYAPGQNKISAGTGPAKRFK